MVVDMMGDALVSMLAGVMTDVLARDGVEMWPDADAKVSAALVIYVQST